MTQALQLSDLVMMADEPCIRDLRLGEALGYDRPERVRDVIARHGDELKTHGGLPQVAVKSGPKGGRPTNTYFLNEAQALLVCMFARTVQAAAIRKQVIDVFLAWRRGLISAAAPAPDVTRQALAQLEARLSALEAAGQSLGRLIARPAESALALTHAPALWFDQARTVRPKFWGDVEVRGLVLSAHRQMTIDEVRERSLRDYGKARTPSRSAIHRFWQRLDRFSN